MKHGWWLAALLTACATESAPEQWSFSSGPPTVDECGLADAGLSIGEGTWERSTRPGIVRWDPESGSGRTPPFVCRREGEAFSCLLRTLGEGSEYDSWARGELSADGTAFVGEATVVSTCGAHVCPEPPPAAPSFPCRSVFPLYGAVLADRYPGPCPPPGTKPQPGAMATLKLIKGSDASGLKIAPLQEDGTYFEGSSLRTEPGEIAFGWPTHIGAWYVIHRKAGGQLTCVGAIHVDAPELRVVIR